MSLDKTPQHVKLDERNHVEKPLLDQLGGLGWEIIDLANKKQQPRDTYRESFTEVVMLPVLREQLKVTNPWLEDDQIEEVVKQLTASFPSTGLLENNKYLFELLLENTSVSENRQTGEKSPTVRFVDFEQGEDARSRSERPRNRDARPSQPAGPDPDLHALLDQRQRANRQNGGPLPAVPCRQARGQAAAGGDEPTRTERDHLAHSGVREVADDDVHGPRDVSPRTAV